MGIADIDSDGRNDVVVGSNGWGSVSIRMGSPTAC